MGHVEKFLSLFSCSKPGELKDPVEYGIEIQPEIMELIEKFDSNIKIKIKDIPTIDAQAPISNPTYIVLSKPFFERRTNNSENFTEDDIMVLVAHELGHIIPKSHFEFSAKLIFIGMPTLLAIITLLAWLLKSFSLYPLLGIAFLLSWFSLSWFSSLSHDEENRADSFAIIEASIPVESFSQCLSRIDIVQRQELALETRWTFFAKSLYKLILNTHPSIDQRILRVRTLYGTKK